MEILVIALSLLACLMGTVVLALHFSRSNARDHTDTLVAMQQMQNAMTTTLGEVVERAVLAITAPTTPPASVTADQIETAVNHAYDGLVNAGVPVPDSAQYADPTDTFSWLSTPREEVVQAEGEGLAAFGLPTIDEESRANSTNLFSKGY